ncbi:MAG TPA: hypothetical protein PJ986_09340 [Gammaproteobacteria bacterium]|nr:hypothetical protein [Gammaproteobacteria bacterium]
MEAVTVTASPDSSSASALGAVRRLGQRLFGDDGFGFKDILDLVNPLQHIPVVGNVYRKLTGDALAPAIRVAGGALFGGPLGAGLSMVGLAVEEGAKRGAAAAAEAAAAELPNAVAAVPRAEVPRGGWMIAAATTGRIAGFAPDEAVASNAAVAVAEAAETPLASIHAAAGERPHAPSASPEQRALRLPARRAIPPQPLPAQSAPASSPLAAATPRSDPRALASFLTWQNALERGTIGLTDYA